MTMQNDIDAEAKKLLAKEDWHWDDFEEAYIKDSRISFEELKNKGLAGEASKKEQKAGLQWLRKKLTPSTEGHHQKWNRLIIKAIFVVLLIILPIIAGYYYYQYIKAGDVIEDQRFQYEKEITLLKKETASKGGRIEKFERVINKKEAQLRNIQSGILRKLVETANLPLELNIKRIRPVQRNPDSYINDIVFNLAFPLYREGLFIGIFSIPANPLEQRGGTGVYGYRQLGISSQEVKRVRKEIAKFLRDQISMKDWIIDIEWQVLPGGGIFETQGLLSDSGSAKFEPILYFTSAENESEHTSLSPGKLKIVQWSGKIKNGLRLTAITWDGKIGYRWLDGRIIGTPKKELSYKSLLPLWRVISEQTGVELDNRSQIVWEENNIETMDATFRLAWSSGFKNPFALTARGVSISIPDLNTGVSRREQVFEIRGDGRVVHMWK